MLRNSYLLCVNFVLCFCKYNFIVFVMSKIEIKRDEVLVAARTYDKTLRKIPMITLSDTLQYLTVMQGIQGSHVLTTLEAEAHWAQYRKNDKDANKAEIGGRSIETLLMSLESTFDPNDVAGKLYNQRPNVGEQLKKLPISAQVLAQQLLFASEEFNMAIFTATKGDGKLPSTSIDGFDTIATKEIAKENISAAKGNLLDLSAYKLDQLNTFDAINYIYMMTDEKLKRKGKLLFYVSPNVLAYYNAGYLANVGNVVYNKQYNQPEILNSNGRAILIPIASKAGSNFIQVTTKENMIFGCSSAEDINTLDVTVEGHYDVSAAGTMWAGCEYTSIGKEDILFVKHGGIDVPTNPFAAASGSASGRQDEGDND